MDTVRKTITLTASQDEWVKSRVSRGDYTNDSEYFRDLIRQDQRQASGVEALREAINKGLDSGIGSRTAADIWAEAEANYRKRKA